MSSKRFMGDVVNDSLENALGGDILIGEISGEIGDAYRYAGDAKKDSSIPFIHVVGGVVTNAQVSVANKLSLRERRDSIRHAQRLVTYPNYQVTLTEAAVPAGLTFSVNSADILALAPAAPDIPLLVPVVILSVGISAMTGVAGGNFNVRITGRDSGRRDFDSGLITISQVEAYTNVISITPWRIIAAQPYPTMLMVADETAPSYGMIVTVTGLQAGTKATLTIPGANHSAISSLLRSN